MFYHYIPPLLFLFLSWLSFVFSYTSYLASFLYNQMHITYIFSKTYLRNKKIGKKMEKPSVCAAKIYFVNILYPLSLFTCCKTKLKKLFFQKEKWNICFFQKNIYSVQNLFIRKKTTFYIKSIFTERNLCKKYMFRKIIFYEERKCVCYK